MNADRLFLEELNKGLRDTDEKHMHCSSKIRRIAEDGK